jgi:hypothetical protein
LIVPYYDVVTFFRDYERYLQASTQETPVSLSTFRRAFEKQKNIKLLGCKGSFHTCEICNNALDLLHDQSKYFFFIIFIFTFIYYFNNNKNKYFVEANYTESQREIIREFQQLHLFQQAAERAYLDKNKLKCRDVDQNGQPLFGMIFSDGMTAMSGNTPKTGKDHHSSPKSTYMESRVIGVEVYCGPISTVFLYTTDNMVSGGANIMIEIQRQALMDLSKLLRAEGLNMPKEMLFQFDNCGENKVIYKNIYLFNLFIIIIIFYLYILESVYVLIFFAISRTICF